MYYLRHFHMSNCSFIFRMIFIFLDIILRNIKNTSTKRGLVNHYRDKWSNEWFELLSNVLRELNLPERVIITRSKSLTSMKRKYKGETSNWKSNKTCNKLAVFSKTFWLLLQWYYPFKNDSFNYFFMNQSELSIFLQSHSNFDPY